MTDKQKLEAIICELKNDHFRYSKKDSDLKLSLYTQCLLLVIDSLETNEPQCVYQGYRDNCAQ